MNMFTPFSLFQKGLEDEERDFFSYDEGELGHYSYQRRKRKTLPPKDCRWRLKEEEQRSKIKNLSRIGVPGRI